MRPILLPPDSVNQSAPSGPTVMSAAKASGVGIGYSVILPLVVMRPIRLPRISVNQSAPSGPATIVVGKAPAVGSGYGRDLAAGRDAVDAVVVAVGDPQRAVAAGGDAGRAALECRSRRPCPWW